MRSVWTSRRAVSLHVALVVFVPGCVALTWWQVSRALGGNTLSWVYTVEWPIFGAYAIYMWWKLVHDDPARPRPARSGPPRTAAGAAAGPSDGDAGARRPAPTRTTSRRRVGGLQPVPGRPQRQREAEAVVTARRRALAPR